MINPKTIIQQIKKDILEISKKKGINPSSVDKIAFWAFTKVTEWQVRKLGGFAYIKSYLFGDEEKVEIDETTTVTQSNKIPDIKNAYGKNKRFVITTAIAGSKVWTNALRSLENYCKVKKAQLLIIPQGITKNDTSFDKSISKYIMTEEYQLNKSITVSLLPIRPTTTQPLVGLNRFTKHSTIFGSPKLFMKPIPTSNYKIPKVIMTTGCITRPYYSNTKVGRMAEQDHTYSAVVVEIEDNKRYHFRQLVMNEMGEFTDLGIKYGSKGTKVNHAIGLVLGDIHVGSVCPQVINATNEMRALLQPKQLIFHDVMDSFSINHHHENDSIIKANKAETGENNLKNEYEAVADFLYETMNYKYNKVEKGIIVESNHDEAVDRYIKEGRYINDPINLRISSKLAAEMLDGKKPLEAYITKYSKYADKLNNLVFLDVDDDYYVTDVQVAQHGHIGSNGARGSIKSQEMGAKKSIVAHSHSPEIFHNVYRVGTSTYLKLEYNKGFSSWLNSHCAIYSDGTRQIINIIEGKWRNIK